MAITTPLVFFISLEIEYSSIFTSSKLSNQLFYQLFSLVQTAPSYHPLPLCLHWHFRLSAQQYGSYPNLTTKPGADVKIMDRFFRHREVPGSENFSKPGFQLKKPSFLGVFVGRTGPGPAGERKQVV
ncbi:hypothetical protein [Weissella confusa]|uniref:hypothetical protein n=1 Tax=Weissella confusa TaxID=1583 RepID=UPI001FB1EE3E|nr:hypothetical protein [Weissella confusa]